MHIKKLLLELDPLKDNAAALKRARTIATGFDAAVDVLVCERPQIMPAPTIMEPTVLEVAQDDYRANVEEWAEAKASELAEAGVSVNVMTTAEQPRYEAILGCADASNADLIMRVVGEHGRLKRLLVGTTDWDLIREAKQPLWLVQPDAADIARQNILVAVDPMHPKDEEMKLDKRLIGFAEELSKALSGSLHLYHTFQATPVPIAVPPATIPTTFSPQIDAAMLDRVASAHRKSIDTLMSGRELPDDHVHLSEGDPAGKIDEVIEANEIGVVVAGSISRSWLDRLLIGSTAESFLDAVNCDLVLLKAES